MIERVAQGKTLAEAYHMALFKLYQCGVKSPCEDYNTTQREVSMTMQVLEPLAEPMISRMFPGGPYELEQYRQELLDGILDFEIEKGKWAYTYHDRIVNQLPFIYEELRRNPSSRRAVIVVRDWEVDSQSTDPACLQHIQYFVRDGELHCKVLFRSNDAVKATFMNAFGLIMLQKRIADELGYKMGTYTHRANSFHVYAKDEPVLKGYYDRMIDADCKMPWLTLDRDELCFNYAGEWDELMEAMQPAIAAQVEELKTH